MQDPAGVSLHKPPEGDAFKRAGVAGLKASRSTSASSIMVGPVELRTDRVQENGRRFGRPVPFHEGVSMDDSRWCVPCMHLPAATV